MDGDNRRKEIMERLQNSEKPLSGTALAQELGVSRQIIVQDIALLRASDKNILSTNKGYILYGRNGQTQKIKKTIKVKHGSDAIREELYLIVDYGGKVLDVVVEHPIYGQVTADLIIDSRMDVDLFAEQIEKNGTRPLNYLTDGIHFHTIEAESEKNICAIEQKLKEKGYLCD